MAFDGLVIKHLINEYNAELIGQRIEKIYQPEKDEIILQVRRKKGSCRILISANARWSRMHTSEERRNNPSQPFAFCMLLRKHIEGAKILAFEQQGLERVVFIRLEALNELMEWQEKILVCEFTGKNSNIVLINPLNGLVLDGIKRFGHELSSYREILPGAIYLPPPAQDKVSPLNLAYDTFYRILWGKGLSAGIHRALFDNVTGLSPQSCREICSLAGLDPDMPVDQCGEFELSRLHETLLKVVSRQLFHPSVVMGKNGPAEFFPFRPNRSNHVLEFSSINEALEMYYSFKIAANRLESRRSNLMSNVKSYLDKAYKKLFLQESDLQQAGKNEMYREWGELLTAYIHQVHKGDTRVSLPNFYHDGTTTIELLPHLTPAENAQRFFKLYTKAKRTREKLVSFINNSRQEIDYLESVMVALEKADSMEDIDEIYEELAEQGFIKHYVKRSAKKEFKSKPRKYVSADGIEILVGRNNRQNDNLTLKSSNKNALWLHAQGYAGTHVILNLPDHIKSIEQVPDTSLVDAALLAAYYSRGREAEKIPVDYTFRHNIRKPKGARPGLVVYDDYWTIYVNPSDARLDSLLAQEDPNP